ncbi:hypothetical protein E2553_44550 [Paraburkholderia dipogonis]|uniref:Cytochrome c domain-containing protein n=1 Tax=Paraburkholderia dipogonis TaxID=1211383 RepID=A0A4Y8MH64_9BURK|nr:PQQ-binding-like beta-propeller repeat protein [Paraburkholderia dipogonis]TFE36734.1 hypothetical protein E2553_44550 [Paraburkholderia dipogonis]
MGMRVRKVAVAFVALATLQGVSMLAKAGETDAAADWRLLGGGHDQQFHSSAAQIDQGNVGKLGLAWYVNMDAGDGLVGQPLIADGVIYQSGPPGRIYANDLKTGKSLWTFTPQTSYPANSSWTAYWASHVNRGLAMDGDNLYVGAYCNLLAVSRITHKLVWSVPSCDVTKMQGITGAPRVGGGKVFIGNASGDMGIDRGFLDAFDGRTGKHLWRFYTQPGDPSKPFESEIMAKAAKTWGTNYWKYTQGGTSPWDAITYDDKSNTVYFGTDGPAPWSPKDRAPDAGDELFTDSILAVDATTGEYKWHFQTVQHDGWNLAATMHIMLADLPSADGGSRRVVMTAPKNGFFYVLDAKTGQFISAKNYVPVNWTKGLDPKTGRAIPSDEGNYWDGRKGNVIPLPGDVGAHSWEPMAYDPKNHLVFIPASIVPVSMYPSKDSFGGVAADYYYGFRADAKLKTHGELIAWDPQTQTARWKADRPLPVNGGVLVTASGLVFEGTGDGKVQAFAAGSGKLLWTYDVGGCVLAAPTVVTVDGTEYLIIASGNGGASGMRGIPRLMNTLRSQGPARLLAFRLGGALRLPIAPPAAFPKPSLPKPADELAAARGGLVFSKNSCSACHGLNAVGPGASIIPDLRMMSAGTESAMHQIVIDGAFKQAGMPAFSDMTAQELSDLKVYIESQAWKGYAADQARRHGGVSDPVN